MAFPGSRLFRFTCTAREIGHGLFYATFLLMMVSLSACGGGSSGGGSSPTVSADTTQFSATVAPTHASPSYQVHFTISGLSGVAIYYAYTYQRTAIQAFNFGFPNPSGTQQSATLSFSLWPPAVMGSGTYQDQVEVEFCLDQQCKSPISGSPVNISITYTVTGNAVSNLTYIVTPTASITIEAADNAASAAATINVAASQLPPYTTYLIGQSKANGAVTNGAWQSNQVGGGCTGTLTVNLKNPMSSGPGVYSDVITVSICYDRACIKEAVGSPWVLPVTYTVTATAGVDYTAQMLPVTASDIAYSAAAQKLYAVTTATSPQQPSSLLEIDPTSAAVTRSLKLTGNPIVLSVSDDGAYAYVGFSDQGSVTRVAMSSMAMDLSIALPVDPTYGTSYAGALLAMPGAAHSFAVSLYTFASGLSDFDSRGTYIFDDATRRPNTFLAPDASTRVMGLAWGADSSTLYAYDGNQQRLFTASTSPMGLTLSNEVGVAIGTDMYYLSGLLYGDDGSVTNADTGARVAEFLQP